MSPFSGRTLNGESFYCFTHKTKNGSYRFVHKIKIGYICTVDKKMRVYGQK